MIKIDYNLDSRIESLLNVMHNLIYKNTDTVLTFSEWGLKKDMLKSLNQLQDLQILFLYMLMTEWKSYEHNTFKLENDSDDCPIIKYPSHFADKDLIACLKEFFHCTHQLDIDSILRNFGVTPVGENPDGIAYMWINTGPTSCDDNIFEVDKP